MGRRRGRRKRATAVGRFDPLTRGHPDGRTWRDPGHSRKPTEPGGVLNGNSDDVPVVRPAFRACRHGGSPQKFFCAAHRAAFHAAARRWAEIAVSLWILSVDDLKADPAVCTLILATVSLAAVPEEVVVAGVAARPTCLTVRRGRERSVTRLGLNLHFTDRAQILSEPATISNQDSASCEGLSGAVMADPTGEANRSALRPDFDAGGGWLRWSCNSVANFGTITPLTPIPPFIAVSP
jgi:hypothetical protein